jgi:cell division protein FtsW
VAFLAFWLGRHQRKIESFQEGFGKPLCMVMLMCGLVVIQPDLGTTAVLFLITFILMFTAGTKWYYIAPLPVVGVVGILAVAFFIPERRERILAFMNPEAHESAAAYQIVQGLIALGSGGIQGMGLGNSVQKFYVPEAHTDSIFALLGEELGLICTLSVVFCFLLIALSGGLISYHAPDPTGTLLGLGATSLICIQAAINIAVVTSLMPAKGMGLPFVSYGGSNLLMSLCCVGILLNIHRQGSYAPITTRRVLPPRATVRM